MPLQTLPRADTVPLQKLCDGAVQIRYARTKQHPYGTLGAPRKVYWEPGFAETVEAAVGDLLDHSARSPLVGELTDLVCAGAWHDTWKTDPKHLPCRHCQGRAIDIDSLWFAGGDSMVTLRDHKANQRLYFAVEAMLRWHFGTVLDALYNAAHRGHFHCDDGTRVGWRPVDRKIKGSAKTYFLQGSLLAVHGLDPGDIDGWWGPGTARAMAVVLCQLGETRAVTPTVSNCYEGTIHEVMENHGGYEAYCRATALVGFGIVERVV